MLKVNQDVLDYIFEGKVNGKDEDDIPMGWRQMKIETRAAFRTLGMYGSCIKRTYGKDTALFYMSRAVAEAAKEFYEGNTGDTQCSE